MRTVLVTLLLHAAVARAQSGGGFDLSHNVIAGGGATFSTGGEYELGGTIGQSDAGTLAGGTFVLHGGFWIAPLSVAPPTPTATRTSSATMSTPTAPTSPSPTTTRPTATVPPTNIPIATNTPTRGPTTAASVSSTPTASPTPSPTATSEACTGDCNQDGNVTVDELIKGVNIALDTALIDICAEMDANDDGAVTVNELIAAVNRALTDCIR